MTRLFRPYGKKRGQRRTGSRRLGSLGEALFFLFFFGVGASGLTLMLTRFAVPEWRANRHFVPAQCVVLNTRIASRQSDDGMQFRPEVLIRYEVHGTTYEAATFDIHQAYSSQREDQAALLAPYQVGGTYSCWYDPADPRVVVLVRGYNWWMWLMLILPTSFVLLGAAGVLRAMLQSSTSVERRSALVRKAAQLDLFDEAPARSRDYPHVPRIDNVTDSPGTHLAYRLPVEMTSGWPLFGMAVFCLFWNGIVVWAAVRVVGDHLAGQRDLRAALVLALFAVAGLALCAHFLRQCLIATGSGATRVEVSGHPFFPGMTYQVFLAQTGRLRIDLLEALLVCEEEAVYQQGTDTRLATERVYQQSFYRRQSLEVRRGRSLEDVTEVHVPVDAMHSFHSDHNEVKWKLIVRAEIPKRRAYQRSFPVVVYPLPEQSDLG
ncbi:MAG: hypothetical protein A2W31_01860 [Planctomycetes bacterium RBG_16_64_10]|nr:MAG: hypothetical protein A2W31_01860 [Planctomycetes bacterium RBG_16_64_10]